jgi:hypothetical protein
MDPVAGERYVLSDESPFPREPVFCSIVAVKAGWVRYASIDKDTNEPILNSYACRDVTIRSFLQIWKRVS